MKLLTSTVIAAALTLAPAYAGAQTLLYNQNFESPNVPPTFNSADVSSETVNSLYGGQPAGFSFAQDHTVETLRIGGSGAFGVGYSDPAGTGGGYVIGFLSSLQDDLLGLSFNVGTFDFLNVRADISSIDLSCCGGEFVNNGDPSSIPIFRFSLFDNPGGGLGVGSGAALDFFDVIGLANPSNSIFLFSEALGGLDATGSTNGNVILQIDLRQGGYAALDNLRVVASNTKGQIDVPGIPEPATWAMMIMGFGAMGTIIRRRRAQATVATA